jgi:hypothetical protein
LDPAIITSRTASRRVEHLGISTTERRDGEWGGGAPEAAEPAERRFVSAVHFHTLFLFATTKSRKYDLRRGSGAAVEDLGIADYISDIFSSSYAQFLLNFETSDLIDAMG